MKAWYAVLAGFKPTTINRAVLTVCASETRFPEVADLFQECRRIEPPDVPYSPHGEGNMKPIYRSELESIAERLGVEV